jgi:hypothetical protein
MGRLHRLAYLAVAVATIGSAVAVPELPRAGRLVLTVIGFLALGSSLSGYCMTCHALGVTTKDDRIRRIS